MSDAAAEPKLSKNELKRRAKAEALALKKAEKAAAKAAAAPKGAEKREEDPEDPSKYYENALARVAKMEATNSPNPYPHKFHVSLQLPAFIRTYEGTTTDGEIKDEEVCVAGRVMASRASGKKLVFYNLKGDGVSVQVRRGEQEEETRRGEQKRRTEEEKRRCRPRTSGVLCRGDMSRRVLERAIAHAALVCCSACCHVCYI